MPPTRHSLSLTPDQRRTVTWLLLIAALGGLAWLLWPVLSLFLLAVVVAYALAPAVEAVVRWTGQRCPRWLATLLVLLVFCCVVIGLLLLIVPILAQELPQLRERLPQLLDGVQNWAQPHLQHLGLPLTLNMDSAKRWVIDYLNTNGDEMLKSAVSSLKIGGSYAMAFITNAVLVPVAVFFLLQDWKPFVRGWLAAVPPRLRESVSAFGSEADGMLGQYLRGQLLVMLLLGVYYSLMLKLFGLKLYLSIGVLTGLLSFVPFLGFGLGLTLASLAALLQFSLSKAVLTIGVVYGLGQLLESFVLTPRLVGERIGLHPLVVIFALMVFALLFGFVGVLVALPVCAVLQVLFKRLLALYYASGFYRNPA